MAKKIIYAEVVIDSAQAAKNTEELSEQLQIQRQVLIDLEKQLYEVEEAQKATSKTNLSAQKKLADQAKVLKSEIKSEKIGLKDLNAQKKLNTITTRNLSKAQADSGQILLGIDEFTGGYASRLKDVYRGLIQSAKGVKTFVKGLSGMKKALVATGVGALVVGLGLVVAYWDEIIDLIEGTNRELKDQQDLLDKQISSQETKLGFLKQQQTIDKLNTGENVKATKEYKKQLILLQALNIALLESLETELNLEIARNEELTTFEKIKIFAGEVLHIGSTIQQVAEYTNDESEKTLSLAERVAKQKSTNLDIEIELAKINSDEREAVKEHAALLKELDKTDEEADTNLFDIELADNRFENDQKLQVNQDFLDALFEQGLAANLKEEKAAEDRNKRIAAMELATSNAKVESAIQGLNAVQNITNAFTKDNEKSQKKGFEINKKLQIAQTIIETYKGATAIFSAAALNPTTVLFPAQPFIAAGAAIASGLANVATIRKQKFSGGGGGGGGGRGGGGGGSFSGKPSGGLSDNFFPTQIGAIPQNTSNVNVQNLNNTPPRAYIVASDISDSTRAQEILKQKSTM